MNSAFKNLCDKINWKAPANWDDVTVISELGENQTIFLKIKKNTLPKFQDLLEFFIAAKKTNEDPNAFNNSKLEFQFEVSQNYFENEDLLEYINASMELLTDNPIFFSEDEIQKASPNSFKIFFENSKNFEIFKQEREKFLKVINYLGLIHLKLEFILEEKPIFEEKPELILEKNLHQLDDYSKETSGSKRNLPLQNYEVIDLAQIRSHKNPHVQFDGQIYKIGSIKTKNGKIWLKIHLNNFEFSQAVSVDKFVNSMDNFNLKTGDLVRIWAIIDEPNDRYKFNIQLKLKKIVKIKKSVFFPAEKIDDAPVKRVEISARTWKSTMDGISSAAEYVKQAKSYGHTAIGIADLDSVQGFPEFYSATQNSGIKPIYGTTFSTYRSKVEKVINFTKNIDLISAKFVIFDLETTGLSSFYNEIIEFGAIVFQFGKEIEKHQFFIRPNGKIPKIITKITGIEQKMIDELAVSPEIAIQKIEKIIENSILVAHNANFDFNFLNQFFKKYAQKKLENPIIDTLEVSRFLNPEARSHSLKNIAKRFEFFYDDEIAHRADFDAEVLTKVWKNFLEKLENLEKITDLEGLSKIKSSIFDLKPEKVFPKQLTMIAKNQAGIKKLYKHVSIANTENLISRPLIFYDLIKKDPDLLVGSGGPESLLIQHFLYLDPEGVEDFSKIYDFIEIPPPSAFVHLVKREIFTQNQIEDMLKKLINLAKKLGIPAVAISDPRYCQPREKIFYELYIYAKGVGGVNHILLDNRESERENRQDSHIFPNKHFFTTAELKKEFEFLENQELIDEIVVKNSNLIANLVSDKIQIIKTGLFPPSFDDSEVKLRDFVYKKAFEKYGNPLPEIIRSRIKNELEPIINHGFHVVYWISKRIVEEAKNQGAIVDSRGSVGSSIVAFLTGITDVNPLPPHYFCANCKVVQFSQNDEILSGYDLPNKKCENCKNDLDKDGHNIPFETFLGFNAEKVPDIDLNFSGETQLKMHDFVRQLFGSKNTFRAGTILTNAEKSVYGLAKKLGEIRSQFDPKFNIDRHVSYFSNSYLDFLATKAQGVKRTSGKHAGGIIVIPNDFEIEDFCPINFPANNEKSDWKTTHFDYNALHDNLLKLDILGHDDPTILLHLEELTGIKSEKIPKNDPKILSLFSSCKELGIQPGQILGEPTGSIGIPEFGTQFVRKMLQVAKVNSFADIVAVCGLAHGSGVWQHNAEPLIIEKKLKIQDVISCRDDIMLYLLKKNLEHLDAFNIMEKVRKGKGLTALEVELLKEKNVPDWYIESLNKIGYMFPKAHAVAYAMKAWKIAFFKLYHPLAFYSAYFSIRPDVKDIETLVLPASEIQAKINLLNEKRAGNTKSNLQNKITPKERDLIPFLEISLELKSRGFEIEKVNLEKSQAQIWLVNNENNSLIPPFVSVDGIGDVNARKIVEARNLKAFASIDDFQNRTETNTTAIKKLTELGVFDKISKKAQVNLFD
ncbi:PolC-type DNA polymerase III [Mycoplasma sp. 'Moose RK']|uniref:PolC-type DNA polymerase III n=1 Tax=Mycoplasma sp. 'Moose RK' TaxID=2780095 RepID=UPI0018C20FC3|nr:PolC-type DNA polymerase III [Mycoplasma sp. 'Moose RK']MBG0730547.1 PolC-type DNA polymerase III [Mycoplasma sp. 'Moose RK']